MKINSSDLHKEHSPTGNPYNQLSVLFKINYQEVQHPGFCTTIEEPKHQKLKGLNKGYLRLKIKTLTFLLCKP